MLPTPPNQVYYRGPFTLYSSAETCGLPTHHPLPTSIPPHPATTGSSHARSSAPTVDTVRVSLLGATITLAVSVAKSSLFYPFTAAPSCPLAYYFVREMCEF